MEMDPSVLSSREYENMRDVKLKKIFETMKLPSLLKKE